MGLQFAQAGSVILGWEFYLPFALMLLLVAFAVPVWVALGMGSLGMLYFTNALPLALIGEALFEGIDAFALIAIPLFVLTGDVLVRTGLSNKLLDIADATTAGFKSGFGTATVLSCGLFACISGSDAAGAAAIGRMTIDRLVEQGYPKAYACALVASGACTGILIPPSIAYIIIGLILGISASTLFLAAVVPGLLIMLTIMLTNVAMNRLHGFESSDRRFSFARWLRAIIDGRYALMVPVVILGGIYTGVFTPTEAAAVAACSSIIIGLLQGTLRVGDFPKMLESSAKVVGIIVPIIALSLPLAQTFAILQIPQGFVKFAFSVSENPIVLLLIMIAILILAGCVMEAAPNIVILSPILFPLAREIGMHDIHFCIVMVTALGVGFITPPLGLNIFVVSSIAREGVMPVAARCIPFVFSMLITVLILAFIPELSLWAIK